MMLRLSIAMAVAAAYVGIIDVNALRGATAVKVATYSAICLGFAVLVFALAVFGLASSYKTMIADNFFDIDSYVRDPDPSMGVRAKCVLLNHLNVGSRKISQEAVPLAETPSPYVSGLRVTSKVGTREGSKPLAPGKNGALIIGTIRMGFGHHRIAYAASSWAVASGRTTYFHDLLNIDSPEAKLIKDMDALYSKGSRLATELGGSVEKIWGSFTKGGDESALRVSYQLAEHLRPILLGLPKDTPIIATHCFVGLAAVALGFTKVINLVIDNHAQWFIVVPGAYNLVQGPSNYHNLLRMGVPADRLQIAGAWIPKDMVDGIEADTAARIARAKARKPRRLLIPVGGAGAQKTFVTSFVVALKEQLEAGKVELFLNAGDHEHMRVAFIQALETIGWSYDTVDTMAGVEAFAEKLRKGGSPKKSVTLFAFSDYFPAVATTDVLSRVADVLCCKPSELAFYPVPKLMIRRVGDHEAYSALRASELGDGTLELREVPEAMAYVEQMNAGPDLLTTMNNCIVANKKIGLYDGCKNAVKLAQELAVAKPDAKTSTTPKAAKSPATKQAKSPANKSPNRPAASPARR